MSKKSTRHPLRRRFPRRIAVGVVMLLALAGLTVVTTSTATRGDRPVRSQRQQDLVREQQARHAPSVWDIDGPGDDVDPGLLHRHQRQRRLADRLQDRHRRLGVLRSRSTASATTAATALGRSPRSRRPRRCRRRQPQCITDATTELYDCGNWAVSASWNVPSTAVSGVYIALLHRADTRRLQPHHLHRARRLQPLRRRLPDLRPDVAGLQQLRRLGLLPGRRQRPRLQDQLQPAGR